MSKEISWKKWILIFITSIIMGMLLYPLAIKFVFRPDFSQTISIGIDILNNLGTPYLKFKAYVCFIILIAPFCLAVIWFFMHKNSKLEDYGSARFATENDFEKMWINHEKGLVLGLYDPKNVLNEKGGYAKDFKKEVPEFASYFNSANASKVKYLRAVYPLSCLMVAPPGTGKTAGIAKPNLYLLHNSCFVLDIKGELYADTAGYRQQVLKNKILKFSPLKDDNTMFFNPFDNTVIKDMSFVEMKVLADQIAGTIFVGEKGKENDHWIVSAKTMFSFFALYFMQKYKHTTLGELAQAPKRDYFDELEGKFKQECMMEDPDSVKAEDMIRDTEADAFAAWLKQVSFDESLHDITRNQARAYSKAAEQEFASVKSTYDTFMAVFSNPQVADAVSKMSFSFRDLREQKITTYVVIQTEEMDILAPLIRILVETLMKTLMSGAENKDPDKFIYLILDEFVRFGKMPFLLEAPALCRSYGLIPLYITQSYEQIKKYYGEDDLNILRGNVGYQIVYTMNSDKDAEELSKLIGDFTRKKLSQSKGNLDFFKHNDSVSSEGYKLVTAQDIKNMNKSESLILVRGFVKNPIKAKISYFFLEEEWRSASKIPIKTEEEIKEELEEEIENIEAEIQEEITTPEEKAKREPRDIFKKTQFPRTDTLSQAIKKDKENVDDE